MKRTRIFCLIVITMILAAYPIMQRAQKKSREHISDKVVISAPPDQLQFTDTDVSKDINLAWDYIESGNMHLKNRNYEAAAESFKKSFSYNYGPKALSGLKLAETYEILRQYDNGIRLVDEMIEKGHLSEKGIQNANEIKARLVASKNTSQS